MYYKGSLTLAPGALLLLLLLCAYTMPCRPLYLADRETTIDPASIVVVNVSKRFWGKYRIIYLLINEIKYAVF